jgi:putative aldouronate transport system substrate-binding protein
MKGRFPMKQKTIRIFFVVLSILLSISQFAGCGSLLKTGGEEEESGQYESVLVNDKSVPIRFYFPGSQPKSWPAVKQQLEDRIKDSVNATLDFHWLEFQSYMQKMGVLDASEEPFDAFCLGKPDTYYPDFTKLAREGKLKDISQLFVRNAPGLLNKFSDEELRYGKVDGKLYAVPSLYPHAYCTYMMVDDALLKKYNISGISDFEQYEAYLKTIKEKEQDRVPGIIANGVDTLKLFARGSGYVIADYAQRLVYKWEDPKMKLTAWEETPEFKEAAYYIADWFSKGYLESNPDQSKVTSFVYYGDMYPPTDETTQMTFSSSSGEMKQSDPLRIFYLYPEKQVQRDNPMGSFFFNGSFVFPASSANADRALQFLDWVQKDKSNYYLMKYGIEGTDYVLDEKSGYPTMPKGMDFSNRTYLYWDGSFAFENIEFLPEAKDDQGNGTTDLRQFLEKNSKYPPHGALYPDYKTMQETADKRAGKFSEFEYKISSGAMKDKSEVDQFIKELEALGSANLVAEVQKQLDEAVSQK